ncbi:MAG: hypothetical protein CME65_00235 [Halobacteriovoraceae bacterium]|nr:hypothetical protein [Halobacteriovoraceae bacterium]
MRKLLSLFFIFTSFNSFGYKSEDIALTDYEFNRYVKPQLISISQDYQSLILQINPELSDYKGFFNAYRDLIMLSLKIEKYCLKKDVNLDCQQVLEAAIKIVRKSFPALGKKIPFSKKTFLDESSIIIAQQAHIDFFKSFTALETNLNNNYYLYLSRTEINARMIELIKSIKISYVTFSDFILKSSDQRFFKEFKAFWTDFIKPTRLYIIPHNDQSLFIQKINDLNLRLNFLNVVLTKRNHPISKQTKTLVTIMHNRWNNILKVTLRR